MVHCFHCIPGVFYLFGTCGSAHGVMGWSTVSV